MPRHHAETALSEQADLDARIEQYRRLILGSLDGLSDDLARTIIVPGKPSLLGVVRHTAYVEGVWFGEAITGRPRTDLGLPVATANSWKTRKSDSIVSVIKHCGEIHQHSRTNLSGHSLDDVISGRTPRTIRSLYIHVLSELAWNTGQLDILRAAVEEASARP